MAKTPNRDQENSFYAELNHKQQLHKATWLRIGPMQSIKPMKRHVY